MIPSFVFQNRSYRHLRSYLSDVYLESRPYTFVDLKQDARTGKSHVHVFHAAELIIYYQGNMPRPTMRMSMSCGECRPHTAAPQDRLRSTHTLQQPPTRLGGRKKVEHCPSKLAFSWLFKDSGKFFSLKHKPSVHRSSSRYLRQLSSIVSAPTQLRHG